jgi:hypothetical protein
VQKWAWVVHADEALVGSQSVLVSLNPVDDKNRMEICFRMKENLMKNSNFIQPFLH